MSQTIATRLEAVRKEMEKQHLDAFIIPKADEYLGEYVPERNERMQWISGFTGSAGIVIVLKQSAAIFVDGRYTVQVKQQVDSQQFQILSLTDNPQIPWLVSTLKPGAQIGYDSKLHSLSWQQQASTEIESAQMQLLSLAQNPIDQLWQQRPPLSGGVAVVLDETLTGASSLTKRTNIGKSIAKLGADMALITGLDSICWLLNIRGNAVPRLPVILGSALLKTNGDLALYTDMSKLPQQLLTHVGTGVSLHPEEQIATALTQLNGVRLLADPNTANAWSQLTAQAAGATLIAGSDPVALPKAQKNSVELEGMKRCHIRDGVAVTRFLAWLDEQVKQGKFYDEAQLADKLANFREQDDNYIEPSFDTISATGSNAAMCHYNHNDTIPAMMTNNSIYLVDSGGQYIDGTTDVTRTIAIGQVSDEQRKMVTLVLKGHIALDQAKFPAGTTGQQLDSLARQYLWQYGFDYDHGTGHGVGHRLSVHEGPQRIAKNNNDVPLLPGMVVSNEPGYYRAEQYGIRLENLVVVQPATSLGNTEREMYEFNALTMIPMDTRLIDKKWLTEQEIEWLNHYHQTVYTTLSPHLQGDELNWLSQATAAI